MAEQISKFRFQKFNILYSSIEIKDENTTDKKLDIELNQEGKVYENNLYESILDVYVFNETKSLEIKAKLKGVFEFDNDLEEKAKKNFFNVNAPAILFPYLRAYITSLTALSGISPIILPTINLAARGKKQDI